MLLDLGIAAAIEHPSRESGLVSDDNEHKAGLLSDFQKIDDLGHQLQVLGPVHISMIDVDNPVAVREQRPVPRTW
jgi:hypothetical protein